MEVRSQPHVLSLVSPHVLPVFGLAVVLPAKASPQKVYDLTAYPAERVIDRLIINDPIITNTSTPKNASNV